MKTGMENSSLILNFTVLKNQMYYLCEKRAPLILNLLGLIMIYNIK
jgi:hypothetical protein